MKTKNIINAVEKTFIADFQNNCEIIVTSPGRINLIGEHIDFNGGYVLPAAINKHIKLYLRKNGTPSSNFYTTNLDSHFSCKMDSIAIQDVVWENYILGVLYEITRLLGKVLDGFDCIIDSNLPVGSGVSSSAALQCGLAKGINELFELGLTDLEIIHLAQRAEHNFVGTNCGIMDQFSVVKGEKNKLLLLDCSTLDLEMIDAEFGPYQFVLLNTNVSHELADSEYNIRRAQCEEALAIINETKNKFKALASVPKSTLLRFKDKMEMSVYNRAKHVVEENYRVKLAVKKIRKLQFKEFGQLMYESHESLKSLFEVSCAELDFLVDYTKNLDFVLGSRMMGGGYGGCTLNLVEHSEVDSFISSISKAYSDAFNISLTPIKVSIDSGIRVTKNDKTNR